MLQAAESLALMFDCLTLLLHAIEESLLPTRSICLMRRSAQLSIVDSSVLAHATTAS